MTPFQTNDIMDISMASTIDSTTSTTEDSHYQYHFKDQHAKSSDEKDQRRRSSNSLKGSIRRTVIFDMDVEEILLPPLTADDLSLEAVDKSDLWYSPAEEQAMMHGALKLAADLRPEDPLARGLEYHTGPGFYRCQSNRDRAMAAVLREQARQQQHEKGMDELLFRQVLERVSKHCQEEATARGRLDEMEAFPQYHVKLPKVTTEEFEYLNNRQPSFFGRVSLLWQ